MDHKQHPNRPEYGPFSENWTISDVVDWIAGEDERCHDERCTAVLAGLDRALSFEPPASARTPSTVVLVRGLVVRLAETPSLGAARLGDVLGAPGRHRLRGMSPIPEDSGEIVRA